MKGTEIEAGFWQWTMRRGLWVALLIILVNIGLKAPFLGGTSLFLDEAVAIHETQGSVLETIEFSASDPTPPLYYLVVGQWCKVFGISEASARFPSMLFSAFTAGLIFLIGRRFFAVQAGLYASLLFTISDVAINFSHEARAYALAGMLMCGSYYAFLSLVQARNRRGWPAVGLVVMNVLLLYTHYLTAMGIAVQAMLAIWMLRGNLKGFLHYVGSQVVVLALWIPWLLMNRARIPDSKVTAWLGPPSWTTLQYVFKTLAGPGWLPYAALAVLVVGGGAAAWRYLSKVKPTENGFALATFAAWFIVAASLQILVSYTYMPVFELRYVLYAFPGGCLLLGALVAILPGPTYLRHGLLLAYLGYAGYRLDLNPQKIEHWREAMAEIKALQDDKTGMVVNAYYQFYPFAYYYKPAYFQDFQHTMPLLGNDNIHLGADTLIVPKIDDSLITNVILVLSHNEMADPKGLLIDYMQRHYCLSYRYSCPGIRLMQFRNPPCKLGGDGHFEWDFETLRDGKEPEKIMVDPGLASNHVTFVSPQMEYSASYSTTAGEAFDGTFKSVEAKFRAKAAATDKKILAVFVMDHDGEGYNWAGLEFNGQLQPNVWTNCKLKFDVPEVKDPKDKIMIYFWTNEKADCIIDDLSIDFWG